MEIVPSENILALRKLSEKFLNDESSDNGKIIEEIKKIIEDVKPEIVRKTTLRDKVKCYDKMYLAITKLLQKLN